MSKSIKRGLKSVNTPYVRRSKIKIFRELNDIKSLMKTIIAEIDQVNQLYKDFAWFSSGKLYNDLRIFWRT